MQDYGILRMTFFKHGTREGRQLLRGYFEALYTQPPNYINLWEEYFIDSLSPCSGWRRTPQPILKDGIEMQQRTSLPKYELKKC
ncbi:unnamed protein product [Timema podura]|uniref:Uncharacterized protein n=1 Tax=Timema podura TaxID=61482 RepID=A0ABN7PAF3_TIMPD|nr:unnamed protein product [Timema podura]